VPVVRVAKNFDLGFQRDTPRDQIPEGAAYWMKDWLPRQGSPLRKRGTTGFFAPNLNAISSFDQLAALGYDPHSTQGDHIVALGYKATGTLHKLFRITDNVTASYVGDVWGGAGLTIDTADPVFHRDLMIFAPPTSAVAVRKYYWTGAAWAIADLGGTPPKGPIAASWGDYLILAGDVPSRMYFSAVGNPESWPANNSIDAPERIVGIVPRGNIIFVIGQRGTHIITGDTPPPGGNLTMRKYAFNQGCLDRRSIASYKEFVFWANANGVWKSDGSSITDLTSRGLISSYWKLLISAIAKANLKIISTVYQQYLIVSVVDTQNASAASTLICDLEREIWFEFGGIFPRSMIVVPAGGSYDGMEHLVAGYVLQQRPVTLRGCLIPDDATWGQLQTDVSGYRISPVLQTPYYTLGDEGLKRFKKLILNYGIQSLLVAPNDAFIAATIYYTPDGHAQKFLGHFPYSTISGDRPPEELRRMLPIGMKSTGISIQLSGDIEGAGGNLMDAAIWQISLDVTPLSKDRNAG
jgi:hypothetical protein